MIQKYKNFAPIVKEGSYIFNQAVLLGNVEIGKNCIIYPNTVIRGENHKVTIGDCVNIQENSCIHTEVDRDVLIGKNVTIGHNAIVHACTIEDNCIIGMGAIVQNGAIIEQNCIIGAAAVVPPNMIVPKGHVAYGVPAKVVRELRQQDYDEIVESTEEYQEYRKELLKQRDE